MPKPRGRLANFLFVFRTAFRTGFYAGLPDYFLYRTPLRAAWARLCGYRFHRSSLVWFHDGETGHSRISLLLPRLRREFPGIESIGMELRFFAADGKLVKSWLLSKVSLDSTFVLDSGKLPTDFDIPKPFNGSLLILQTLHHPEKEIYKRQGVFGSTHTYIDYYKEGSFITTLHDYSAFLPDQVVSEASLGMIPAYCDNKKETFLLFHAASDGVGPKDLNVYLYDANGKEKVAALPRLKPFAMVRLALSELFPDARVFLAGGVGQVVVKGVFRKILRRTAYGILDRKSGAYSLDHCYYSAFYKRAPITAAQRERIPKGWSNPFFVLEDERTTTAAMLFQSAEDGDAKHVDLLVYDAAGKCVLSASPYAKLEGDRTERISIRKALESSRIPLPFSGHAEILYHKDPDKQAYAKDLDVYVEYERDGKTATIIFGSDPWNASRAIQNRSYRSGCRIVCDSTHTTRLAISNCSHDYDYALEVPFTLTLVADGRPLDSKQLRLAPNATLFRSVEELFPEARQLLEKSGGVGLVTTTDINCSCLTHLFFTEDRFSQAFSVEHSLDV